MTFVLSRVVFGIYIFFTAFYCLLYYVPFTRHTLFDWNVVPLLTVFARHFAILSVIGLLPVFVSLIPHLLLPRTRRITLAFMSLTGLAAIFLFANPILAKPPEDERTFVWALLSILPLLWVAVLDWQMRTPSVRTDASGERSNLAQVFALAASVSLIFLAVFAIRYRTGGFTRNELCLIALFTFAAHFVVFASTFAAFRISTAIARKLTGSETVEIIIRTAIAAIAAGVVLRKVVFVQISFTGSTANVVAVVFAVAFITYISVSLVRFGNLRSMQSAARHKTVVESRFARLALAFPMMAAAAIFAYASAVRLQGVDWNGLLQQISVLVVWLANAIVFRAFAKPTRTRTYSWASLVVILCGGLVIYLSFEFGKRKLVSAVTAHAPAVSTAIDRYAGYDPSFALTGQILAPARVDVFETSDTDPFFALLRQNTNIAPDIPVTPVDVNLAELSDRPATSDKPHIFIFVIDSLRQDYLSPYNPSVKFTPNIEAFAHESTVMRNAFTRYGGTALAEPSIWTGTMQLHKQFVQPFYPMNSLQKLVDADGYTPFLTIDPILKSILKPSNAVELNHGADWKDYDFVDTLTDLQTKLSGPKPQRIFAYSQPQNLHLVSLKHTQRQFSQEAQYAGFEAQHAFEVERIDKAFGDFVRFLKSNGLYDDSIIVVTSDHGDSLGENGHWGHGSALFPEVIRIPLIIHLPDAVKHRVVNDPNAVAFSTDIAPTLYYLLGHRPIHNDPLFGRPLFTMTMQEQESFLRESYLIVDSYGPVYGLLRDEGRTLFVADAIKNEAYLYDLTRSYSGTRTSITDELVSEYEKTITRDVQKIQTFYNFQPAEQKATAPAASSTIAQLYSLLFSK